ncbi:sulfotransferase [Fulvivirga sedimenti]|uniref:Sulfotransferase n=1 Tax=Fulvivirga sedimenti TaxID=2879465 RepID=A0A9X1KVY9_9BACT|nr:sulfotransferase [Fulvivirga sedimenti]MCA6073429.1 sulfotransferase [Fulvivirga sedimenti]
MEDKKRSLDHKKIKELENIFPEMIRLLGPSEMKAIEELTEPKHPVLLIVGCARSGSTLLYQYMAASGICGYPSNLISRFYYAPYIGARVQQLLTDFDMRNEILGKDLSIQFNSELGKTRGALQPHEFWYFWNRFFEFSGVQKLLNAELEKVDISLLNKELAGLQNVFNKPLVLKAMNLNWHIDFLANASEKFRFIFLERNIADNATSLLNARIKYFGDINEWYSFKPPTFDDICKLAPHEQVVEQVIANNEIIAEQLKKLDSARYSIIRYDEFIARPQQILGEMFNHFGVQYSNEQLSHLPDKFFASKSESGYMTSIQKYLKER